MPLSVNIITPERIVLASHADAIALPGILGEMELRPGHAALLTLVKPGEVRVKREGVEDKLYVVGSGLCEIVDDAINLLVDTAEGEDEIDVEQAKALLASAKDHMAEIDPENEEERFAFETALATARARIEVFEKTSGED